MPVTWLVNIDEALNQPTSPYRQAIPKAISIHKITTEIEKNK